MADITTIWDADLGRADWAMADGAGADLISGDDLASAVLISLFTDAEAGADDVIPDGTTDPRGWWADAIGSKLWLRARSKNTATLLATVRNDIADALRWLVDDKVASAVDVTVEWQEPNRLGAQVVVRRAAGDVTLKYSWAWGD